MVWSSRTENSAILMEVAGDKQNVIKIDQPIFWNFNQYYSESLVPEENPVKRVIRYVKDREELASEFPVKKSYSFHDLIHFLRLRNNAKGEDYSWSGSRTSICNVHTQMTTLFDPDGDGFYFGYSNSFGSLSNIYHYGNDFTKEPVLFAEDFDSDIEPVVKENAFIENKLVQETVKLGMRTELAEKHPQSANMQFMTALNAFQTGDKNSFIEFATKAYTLDSKNPEYGLYYAIALLSQKKENEALFILKTLTENDQLSVMYMIYIHYAIQKIDRHSDSVQILDTLLEENDLKDYAESDIFSLIDRMM